MKKLTLTTLSLIATLAAGSALAEEHGTPPKDGHHKGMHEHMFKKTDSNGDGAISKEEWTAKGDQMFKEIDANADGKLAHEEMKAHHEKKREAWKERREERKEKLDEKKGAVKEKLEEKKAPATPAEKH